MALLAHGERIMNTKRFAALAAFAALLTTAGPAVAANPTGQVTVKWNTQTLAAITMYTQTTASKTSAAPAANDIYWGGNGSTTSGCNGTTDTASAGKDGSGGNGAWAALTVNFGNVTPDAADYTNCLEINAIDAYVTTNDSAGYTVSYAISGQPANYAAASNGALLCLLQNGTWANGLAWTASARVAAVSMTSTTACSSGTALVSAGGPLLTSAASTTGTELNGDLQLNLGPNASTGSATTTVTYTLTPS